MDKTSQHHESLTAEHRALDLFVDRHDFARSFAEYLNTDPPPEKLLFFYGDGGNGKSLLLKSLLDKCCKRFSVDDWQECKVKSADEIAAFLQESTDWKYDFISVPAALIDFSHKSLDDAGPQHPFYGLLMLHQRLVKSASNTSWKLQFPLYEYACACYLHKEGKLTNDYIAKLFPSQELFVLGGVANLAKSVLDSQTLGLTSVLTSLTASTMNAIAKYYGKDLTLYFRENRLKQEPENLQKYLEEIGQLDSQELLMALPDFWVRDLHHALKRPGAPERVVLLFDTHEAFWGNWRRQGDARFFEQDKWFRRFIQKLIDLDALKSVVVGISGRELPRWHEASDWQIPREILDPHLVWHLTDEHARDYLERVGNIEKDLYESLIGSARVENDQVHPLFLGLCADIVLAAHAKGEVLKADDFLTTSELDAKGQVLMERLLRYVDDDIRDAVDALSACRAFNRELYFKIDPELHLQATHASFRSLTQFSFTWPARHHGQDWYRIHPLVRRINLKANRELTCLAHPILKKHYRQQGDIAEAIYHSVLENWEVGLNEWLEAFKIATQNGERELCQNLLEIRKELNI